MLSVLSSCDGSSGGKRSLNGDLLFGDQEDNDVDSDDDLL